MGADTEGADARLEWLEKWVELKLSAKPAVFKKMLAGDGGAAVQQFLSNPDCRRVFVISKDKDNKELLSADLPPAALLSKRRAVYFCKIERQPVTAENIEHVVMPGDLLPDVLAQTHRLCETGFLPLIANPENQRGWPALVMSDLVDGLARLVALIYVTLGQSQGRTLLPLPVADTSAPERASRDKERVHACEAAVATWTRQIKAALKAEPEAPSPAAAAAAEKAGLPPPVPLYTPLHELEFWSARAANLSAISAQLRTPRVRKVVRVLQLAGSSWSNALARLEGDVGSAAAEAADTVRFLGTLRADLEALEQTTPDGFAELASAFRPLFHRALLVWCHSRHYNTAARLAVLIRQVGNALVERAREFLDPDAVFTMEPQDMLEKLGAALEVLAAYKAAYFEVRDASLTRYARPDPPERAHAPTRPRTLTWPGLEPTRPIRRRAPLPRSRRVRARCIRWPQRARQPVEVSERGALRARRPVHRALPRPARAMHDDRAVLAPRAHRTRRQQGARSFGLGGADAHRLHLGGRRLQDGRVRCARHRGQDV